MKLQCFIVIISLIKEFTRKFLNQDLINVIGIIYHWYWLNFDVETTFLAHVALLKPQYHFDKEFGEEGLNLPY